MHVADLFRTLDSEQNTPASKQKALVAFIEEVRRYYITLNTYGMQSITSELQALSASDKVKPESKKIATLLSYLTVMYHYTINQQSNSGSIQLESGAELIAKIFSSFYESMLDNLVYKEQYSRKEAASYLALNGVSNRIPIRLTND